MKPSGNTILITGGGSGIGRGLAEAFHAAGNDVIIAGRREEPLAEVVKANPGMSGARLDVTDGAAITSFVGEIIDKHPSLNVLINNAGVMKVEDVLAEPFDLLVPEATIASNLLGPIRLIGALLPHLRRQSSPAIINVSSGLAFVPLAATPTYSATKAALHSYTQSLRFLLRDTAVEVIELAPPMVATDLMPGQRANPRAMPLEDFLRESMSLLTTDGSTTEVLVERVKMFSDAENKTAHGKVFAMINSH